MGILAEQSFIVDIWDVGQGDCSVIRLPSGEIVLIDVGPRGSPVVDWLVRHPPRRISHLVLTHNDADHIGALGAVVDSCKGRIGKVLFLEDRSRKDERFVRLVSRLDQAVRSREVDSVQRLESPHVVDLGTKAGVLLEVRFPDCIGNVTSTSPNDTSAILALTAGGRALLIWTSDSTLDRLRSCCEGCSPQYMIGPHHGAPADRRHPEALSWLQAVDPRTVILSVGSNNQHDHPQINYIRKVLKIGGSVRCTQLTKLCERPGRFKDVVKSHALLGLPQPRSGFACRGPIRLFLQDVQLVQRDNLDQEHAEGVRSLTKPKCTN